MKHFIIIISTLMAFGCSSSNNNASTAASNDGKICKMEKTTGSNIATRVCRTAEQIAYDEKIAKEAMKEMTRGSVNRGN